MNCIRSAYTTAGAESNKDVSRDLQLSGQSIKSIILADVNTTRGNKLLGKYCVDGYHEPDNYNIKINDRLMYSKPIERESQKLNELANVMGRDLHISMGEYSYAGIVDESFAEQTHFFSAATFEGQEMRSNLENSQHWIGIDTITNPFKEVGNGLRSNKQITFERKVTTQAGTARELKYFVHVERILQMKGGFINVSS